MIEDWVAGFTAGEGCFACFAAERPRGFMVTLAFTIKVRADDKAALEIVRDTIGVGYVLSSKVYRGSHEQVTYQVTKAADLLVVVDFFERHPLRARKADDFAFWKQAVRLLATKQRGKYTPEQRTTMLRLVTETRAARAWGVR